MSRFTYHLKGPVMRVLAALPLLTMAMPAVAADPASELDRIAAHFARAPITGMTIAVARGGRILHAKGYGLADAERGVAADRDTIYEAGSIAKTFTAAAIFRLAEQGKLTLDDPVGKHFPELGEAAKDVTLRHLLRHSSGLFSGNLASDLTKPFDHQSVAPQLATRPREFPPGERFRYNNNGYLLLGLLIERVSGLPYHQYLAHEFLKPLKLRSTGACAEVAQARRAIGYVHAERGDAKPTRHPIHHPTVSFSAGALCSTAPDLAAWQHALVAGRVLRADSKAAMTTPSALTSGKPSPYGMGMFVDEVGGEPHLHHGGASSGFITQMAAYRKDGTVVVVLTNGIYAGSLVEQVETAALKATRGEAVTFVPDLPTSAAERASHVGAYELGPMKLEVYEQGSHLRAKPPGQVAARLLHQGGQEYVAEHDPSLSFRFQRTGGSMTLLMAKNGREMPPARRIAEQTDTDPNRLVESLLAADRAHAEQARAPGLDGLLAMFDDEVLMPSPNGALVRGKAEVSRLLRQSSRNVEGKLSWAPIRGGISADGGHGFTFGYMDATGEGNPPRKLKYLSYWQKKAGQWRVVAFKRAPHPDGTRTSSLPASLPSATGRTAGDSRAEQLALASREQAFSDKAQQIGLGKAFAAFGHGDAVNFGRSAAFTIGKELEASGLPKLSWKADGALVAPSGDLGLTWGMILAVDDARSAIPFFTVWRRDGANGEWLYVAE